MRVLDIKEIIKIMKACRSHGVEEFAHGDLRMTFNDVQKKVRHSVKKMEAIARKEDLKEQIKDIGDDTDLLLIEDPLKHEEQLANGDLMDDSRSFHQ